MASPGKVLIRTQEKTKTIFGQILGICFAHIAFAAKVSRFAHAEFEAKV